MRKSVKEHVAVAFNGKSITMPMSNAQENYHPHWIVRFTDVFVADCSAMSGKTYKDKTELVKELFLAFCEKHKQAVEWQYDMQGIKGRVTEAKPDVTDVTLAEYIAAFEDGMKEAPKPPTPTEVLAKIEKCPASVRAGLMVRFLPEYSKPKLVKVVF